MTNKQRQNKEVSVDELEGSVAGLNSAGDQTPDQQQEEPAGSYQWNYHKLLDTAYAIVGLSLVDAVPTITYIDSIVVGVPADVSREDLKRVVELAGRAPSVNGRPWQEHALIAYSDRAKYAVDMPFTELSLGDRVETFWVHHIDSMFRPDGRDCYGYAQLCAEIKSEKRITLRMPLGLHSVLAAEAEHAKTSLNELCVSKLYNSLPAELREMYIALDQHLTLVAEVGIDKASELVDQPSKSNNKNG